MKSKPNLLIVASILLISTFATAQPLAFRTLGGDTLRIVHGGDTLTVHLSDTASWQDGRTLVRTFTLGDTALLGTADRWQIQQIEISEAPHTSIYLPNDTLTAEDANPYTITTYVKSDTVEKSDLEMVHIDGNSGSLKVITRDGKGFKIIDGSKQYRINSKSSMRLPKWKHHPRKKTSTSFSTISDSSVGEALDDAYDVIEETIGSMGSKDRARFRGHWAGVEWGFCWMLDPQWGMRFEGQSAPYRLKRGRSYMFALNPLQYSIDLIGNRFGLVTGVGFSFKRYEFPKQGILLQLPNRTETEEDILSGAKEIASSRLRTYHFTIPILFEYQNRTPRFWRRRYIALGAIGDVLISSNYQVKTGDGRSYSYHQSFNLADLQVAPTLRLGIGPVRLFINIYPLGLFERGAKPQLVPFEVGVALLHF